jgi:ribonuclease R
VKDNDRIALKRILKELEGEGVIARTGKRAYAKPGRMPEVTVLEITGQDPDGELLARPTRWDNEEPPPTIIIIPGRDAEAGGSLGRGERILARLSETRDGYEARIIKKLGASVHRVLGVYHASARDGRIAPIDRKTRTEFIVDTRDNGGAQSNELVLAEPLAGRASGLPRARIVERLGSMNAPKAISLIAIHAHGIPTEFPKAVLDETARAEAATLRSRTDLRKIPLVTIDPEDARDHDDAVWAGPDDDTGNPGGHVVIVAIADVAHYVTSGSALDKEALKRGNSAYFPDRVVPMLPEELSADLCSLKEGVDRPCLAVRMVFDSHGHQRSHHFMRGVMRSAARLTYARAQAAFDGHPDPGMSAVVKQTLADLWAAYKTLTIAREKRQPLDLDLPERRIKLSAEGHIDSIAFRERLESMRLIEECMVLANVAAAEALEKARTPLIYRVHDTPSKEKLYAFSDFLRTLNISFAKGQVVQPGTFNRVLKTAKGTPHEAVMNDVVLRSQAQAIYDAANIGHFGLNLAKYAHFTSPIRRYADLIVHRALVRGLKLPGDDGLTDREIKQLPEIAEAISITERRAMAAERDSTDRYVAAFMEEKVGGIFKARITGVTKFGLFVRLTEFGAEGLLPARSLGSEYFRFDERALAMRGERTGVTYKMGDTVEVKLVEAAPVTGGLRFELAEAKAATPHGRHPKPDKKTRFKPKRR